eukprot:4244414-Heterocapsa_arctica.AAC.1
MSPERRDPAQVPARAKGRERGRRRLQQMGVACVPAERCGQARDGYAMVRARRHCPRCCGSLRTPLRTSGPSRVATCT